MSKPHKRLVQAFGIILCLTSLAASQTGVQTSGALLFKLECPDRVKDVAFSPDGRLLAAGYGWNEKGGVTIWNLADRTTVATLSVGRGDDANVECVAFSPDGKLFAAASRYGDVMLWTVGSWRAHKTVITRRGSSQSLGFSPDGARLAFAAKEVALLYDLRSGKTLTLDTRKTPDIPFDSFVSASFSPDGLSVFVCRDDAVEVRDAESGKLLRSWKSDAPGFFGRTSPDGRYVIAGGGSIYGEKSVEIWDAADGRRVGRLDDFRSGLFGLAISNSGRLFAVAGGGYGGGGDVSLWELNGAREVGYVSFGRFPIQALAFSPDDRLLAAASDDGFVLLYAVDRIRGPQLKRRDTALCGEIAVEENRVFVVPLSKVPTPMSRDFQFAWKLEVADASALNGLAGSPVVLKDWAIESSAANDRTRIDEVQSLLSQTNSSGATSNYVVFGDVRNPGWDESFIAKVYGDGSFVATNNSGKCLAYGQLSQLNTDFASLKNRLVGEGLLSVPVDPLTLGVDHYRTRFIELTSGGARELRSDADSIEVLLNGGPAKKREAFSRIFELEEQFLTPLLRAGTKQPPTNAP